MIQKDGIIRVHFHGVNMHSTMIEGKVTHVDKDYITMRVISQNIIPKDPDEAGMWIPNTWEQGEVISFSRGSAIITIL